MSSTPNASRAKLQSSTEPTVGDVVADKYRIEAVLGRGGMGAVFRAQHTITSRRVALKWLHSNSDAMRKRFFREARAMAVMEHPNVVGVLDMGEHAGAIFLVMEFLEGSSLRQYTGKRAIRHERALKLLMPALEGVAAAHLAGLIHRDLKPDNLFVCQDVDGTAYDTKVLDFGIARPMEASSSLTADLTLEGSIIGTPRYMAPEQILGDDVDQRADVFALGLILWEMLVGQLPYRAENYEQLVVEVTSGTMPSPRAFEPSVPEQLAQVVLRALEKNREARYPDVASFAKALAAVSAGLTYRPPRSAQIRRARFTLSHGDMAPPPGAAQWLKENASHERAVLTSAPTQAAMLTASTRDVGPPRSSAAPTAALKRMPQTRRSIETDYAEPLTTSSSTRAAVRRRRPAGNTTDSVRLPVRRGRTRRGLLVGVVLVFMAFVAFASLMFTGVFEAAESVDLPPDQVEAALPSAPGGGALAEPTQAPTAHDPNVDGVTSGGMPRPDGEETGLTPPAVSADRPNPTPRAERRARERTERRARHQRRSRERGTRRGPTSPPSRTAAPRAAMEASMQTRMTERLSVDEFL